VKKEVAKAGENEGRRGNDEMRGQAGKEGKLGEVQG